MKILFLILAILAPINLRVVAASVPAFSEFEPTQFSVDGNKVSILPGALTTNLNVLHAESADYATLSGRPTNVISTINVLDYGADRTGTYDTTTNIQAALDAVSSFGGRVFIPNGYYRVYGTLYPKKGTTIEGEWQNTAACGIYHGGSDTILLMVTNSGITLRDLNLWAFSNANGTGIKIAGSPSYPTATAFRMERVKLSSFKVGISIYYSWIGDIVSTYVQGSQFGMMWSNNVNDIRLIGGEIGSSANVGLHVSGPNSVGNHVASSFESNGIGIVATNLIRLLDINGCYFEGNTNADIYADGGVTWQVQKLGIQNSTFCFNRAGTNIILRNCRSPYIANNLKLDLTSEPALAADQTVSKLFRAGNDYGTSSVYDSSLNPLVLDP